MCKVGREVSKQTQSSNDSKRCFQKVLIQGVILCSSGSDSDLYYSYFLNCYHLSLGCCNELVQLDFVSGYNAIKGGVTTLQPYPQKI